MALNNSFHILCRSTCIAYFLLDYGFSFHAVIVFLGNNLDPSGQLNLAMLWNIVDIARNKIIKEVAEKGNKWTVS